MRLHQFCHLARRTFVSAKHFPQHQDIPSFLQYAESVSLSPETTVYVGTLYEYTVLSALSSINMTLDRCGGKGDRGIDLHGTWTIPTPTGESPNTPRTFPVVVSCKVTGNRRVGPQMIRELEGTMRHASQNTVRILATTSHCTPGTKRQMLSSSQALAYCYIEPYEDGGSLSQFVWNKPANVLLKGLGASIRHAPGNEEGDGEVVLTLNGQILGKLG